MIMNRYYYNPRTHEMITEQEKQRRDFDYMCRALGITSLRIYEIKGHNKIIMDKPSPVIIEHNPGIIKRAHNFFKKLFHYSQDKH